MEKYLAIHDWSQHQSGKGNMGWIKVMCHLEDNDKFAGLSLLQQGLLVGLWRLRGRTGKNVLNDATRIARALDINGTDRPHLQHAISTLIARGLLVPTNQQDGFSETPIDKRREEQKREEKKASAHAALPIVAILDSPEGVDECVEKIQAVWKKPCGQLGMKACLEAFAFESKSREMGFLDAARRVRDKTLIVADLMAQWPPGEQKFIPRLDEFMKSQAYENPYETWERGNGKQDNPERPNQRSAAELIAEREEQSRQRLADLRRSGILATNG